MIRERLIGDTGEVPLLPSRRQGVSLSRRTTIWTLGMAAFNIAIAFGIRTDPDQFNRSIYRIHREVMPMGLWCLLWVLGGVGGLLVVFTRSIRLWVLTSIYIITYSACWAICIVIAKIAGENISPNGLALWGFVLFAMAFSIMSPLAVKVERTIDVDSTTG